jgi:hypothetical protein
MSICMNKIAAMHDATYPQGTLAARFLSAPENATTTTG